MDDFMEAQIAMLVQEAEKLYNKLVRDLTNIIIYDAAFSSSGTSSSLPLLSTWINNKVVISSKVSSPVLIKSSNIGALAKIITMHVGETYPDIEKQLAKRQKAKRRWLKRLLIKDGDDTESFNIMN